MCVLESSRTKTVPTAQDASSTVVSEQKVDQQAGGERSPAGILIDMIDLIDLIDLI